jgi:DNA-directed RNA polymerase alpha subunit
MNIIYKGETFLAEELTMSSGDIVLILRRPPFGFLTLDSRIEELKLSARATNCLRNDEIKTVRQLVDLREAQLLLVPNMGRVTVTEIKQKLAQHGLHLDMQLQDNRHVQLAEDEE